MHCTFKEQVGSRTLISQVRLIVRELYWEFPSLGHFKIGSNDWSWLPFTVWVSKFFKMGVTQPVYAHSFTAYLGRGDLFQILLLHLKVAYWLSSWTPCEGMYVVKTRKFSLCDTGVTLSSSSLAHLVAKVRSMPSIYE